MEQEKSNRSDEIRMVYSKEGDYFSRINRELLTKLKSPDPCPRCHAEARVLVRDGTIFNRCVQCSHEY